MNSRLFVFILSLCSYSVIFSQDDEEKPEKEKPVYTSLSKALRNSKKVYKLDLRNNGFTSFPEDVFKLENLEVLILDSNNISTVPKEIGSLKHLQLLSLSYNGLESLPDEISECDELWSLYLDHNKLKSLPEKFFLLKKLGKLGLKKNELTTLPPDIRLLQELYVLDCAYNNLKKIPDEIGYLFNMSSMSFDGNKIRTLPPHFFELTNLKILYLAGNELEKVDTGFVKLKKLEILALEKNKISRIASNFGDLGSLKKLYIGNNLLETLPDGMGNLYNLSLLDLDENPLKSIPPTFKELRNLKTLYVKGIEIKPFPQVYFDMAANNTKIDGLATKEIYNCKLLFSKARNKKLVENYDEAISSYEEGLKMDTNNVVAYAELAQCYLQKKEFEKAEKYAKKALLKDPPAKLLPEIQLTIIKGQNKTNDEVSIVKTFEDKWKADPKNAQPLLECGKYFYYNNKKEEAKPYFERAVVVDPDNSLSHFYLAITSLALDKKEPFVFSAIKYVISEPKTVKTKTMLPFLFTRLRMKTGVEGKKGSMSYRDSYIIRDENGEIMYRSENSSSDLLAAMLGDLLNNNLIKEKKDDSDSAKTIHNILKQALNVDKNNVEIFKSELKRLCEPDSTKEVEKFAVDFYLPFYNELIAKGHLETLSYLLNQARREEDYIEDWIKANPEKIKAFNEWYKSYKWPVKN